MAHFRLLMTQACRGNQNSSLNLARTSTSFPVLHRHISMSALVLNKSDKVMSQVEVDDPAIAKKLGKMQMNFVKKAERTNSERADRHIKFRRRDWQIAGFCFFLIAAIYSYTIFAIKQETFLDDFDMPDPLEEKDRKE